MRSTSSRKHCLRTILICLVAILLAGPSALAPLPEVQVVYPKMDQIIGAVDSTFIFGHLPSGLSVDPEDIVILVNGHWTDVHEDGGFLAFVPITSGAFTFDLRAYRKKDLAEYGSDERHLLAWKSLDVVAPQPQQSVDEHRLEILGDYNGPMGDLVLAAGDRLEVMFRGTPELTAWFAIPGVADSVPMTETAPHMQPYWGEAVFGAGAVPDSLMLRGIYAGSFEIPAGVSRRPGPITYYMASPEKHHLFLALISDTSAARRELILAQMRMPDTVSSRSSYLVTVNPPDYPFTVWFTDSVQIIRHGPRRGYFSIFQPEGVQALVVGAEGDWYKARMSETQFAWINKNSVERLGQGITPPTSRLISVRTYASDDGVTVEFPLKGKHPFRVIEDDKRTIRVQLFGVLSDTDWIRYDFDDPMIDIATWSQPEPGMYELRIRLNADLWGYDSYYHGNSLYFKLNKAPEETWRLKGKRIVVDPGHSQDPGAIGATGMTEAEANLGIALVLEKMLKAAGAEVIMTRDDTSHVELYDRPAIAKLSDADIFVSIHNNALPDGVNPFENHGVSTYYYHPHSIELARAIQAEMLKATDMPSHGLYHGNLAVNRPTQYPAVLVECAFMMIPEQEAALKTYSFRKKVAGAVMRGIEQFLKGYDND